MQEILSRKLALREQFEILYVKSVLKPVIRKIIEFNEEEKQKKEVQALSDNEDEEKENNIEAETTAAISPDQEEI